MEWPSAAFVGTLAIESMIVDCTPRGICSWDYLLRGEGHSAEVRLRTFGEGGELIVDGSALEVRKGPWLSGEWSLLHFAHPVLLAHKPSAFRRRFEFSGPAGGGVLEPASFFGRAMRLDAAGAQCSIQPVHVFTRRATIEGRFEDFRVVAFAFWLTALLWRRAARNNSSGGGSGS